MSRLTCAADPLVARDRSSIQSRRLHRALIVHIRSMMEYVIARAKRVPERNPWLESPRTSSNLLLS
eukprot:7961545-Pyramimonas_sp.AAC.2